jgi:Holliday junction resolvase RusA-like endonuclease
METALAQTYVYIIHITPQTHVRATQGDKIYFRIPREKLKPAGLARLERLERYNKYKIDLMALCKVKRFILPSQGLHIRFFIPMPKTWKKWQREIMNGKLHRNKPDIDNLLKAVFDSLLSEDKFIGHIGEVSKHWTDKERGWIEFTIKEAPYQEALFPKYQRKKQDLQ